MVRVQDVTIVDERGVVAIRKARFDVRRFQILGIAAVEGSGHRELLRALAGRMRAANRLLHRAASVGFVPEDRQREALVLEFSLAENFALRGAGGRHGLMQWRKLHDRMRTLLTEYDIRGGHPDTPARRLSGGHQQRLVLARKMDSQPDFVVVENPIRGLHIRATETLHQRLRSARDTGTAVVLYSSDLDEVLALANRIMVVHAGRVREVARDREVAGRATLGLG